MNKKKVFLRRRRRLYRELRNDHLFYRYFPLPWKALIRRPGKLKHWVALVKKIRLPKGAVTVQMLDDRARHLYYSHPAFGRHEFLRESWEKFVAKEPCISDPPGRVSNYWISLVINLQVGHTELRNILYYPIKGLNLGFYHRGYSDKMLEKLYKTKKKKL